MFPGHHLPHISNDHSATIPFTNPLMQFNCNALYPVHNTMPYATIPLPLPVVSQPQMPFTLLNQPHVEITSMVPYEDLIRHQGVDLIRTACCLLNSSVTLLFRATSLFQRYCDKALSLVEKKALTTIERHPKLKQKLLKNASQKGLGFNNQSSSVPCWGNVNSEAWSLACYFDQDQVEGDESNDILLAPPETYWSPSELRGPPVPYRYTPWEEADWIQFPMDILRYTSPFLPSTLRPESQQGKRSKLPQVQVVPPNSWDASILSLAAAAVLIVAKMEDPLLQLRSIIYTFDQINKRRKDFQVMDINKEALAAFKSNVLAAEKDILSKVAFETAVDCPHKYALLFLELCVGIPSATIPSVQDEKSEAKREFFFTLLKTTISFCNGSALSPYMCVPSTSADEKEPTHSVGYTPQTVACAAIMLAMAQLKVRNALTDNWSLAFDVPPEDMKKCADEILRVVSKEKRIELCPACIHPIPNGRQPCQASVSNLLRCVIYEMEAKERAMEIVYYQRESQRTERLLNRQKIKEALLLELEKKQETQSSETESGTLSSSSRASSLDRSDRRRIEQYNRNRRRLPSRSHEQRKRHRHSTQSWGDKGRCDKPTKKTWWSRKAAQNGIKDDHRNARRGNGRSDRMEKRKEDLRSRDLPKTNEHRERHRT